MQFEQHADGSRTLLPKPSIDTGMGLERVAAVLQGVHNNYDVDLFRTLIAASESLTGVKAEGDSAPSHRVIADHLRTSAFLIADGVTPSNEGRGYVLRRIMRRAMRHAHLLGAQDPLMHRLVPTLVGEMGAAYGELRRAEPAIIDTLRQEEERFRRTLGRGMGLLDEATANLAEGGVLSGEVAFRLYDTYGFPLDLTQDAVRAKGLTVDTDGFDVEMEKQRAGSRANWAGSGQKAAAGEWFAIRDAVGATRFSGYDAVDSTAMVTALVLDGARIEAVSEGQTVQVLTDITPFYAESGGQAGDRGLIEWAGGSGQVLDTQKQAGDLHVHAVRVLSGDLAVGTPVALHVEPAARLTTRANHSAAHLLHAALRHVLGPHVSQKGQMVDGERIRFDFSHGAPLSPAEVSAIEAEVNKVVLQNLPADTRLMAPDQAIEAGAMALFGEKYGDEVRVLTLGRALEGDGAYSVELCGGTHVGRTGDIGLFCVISEQGVAAGVRRIEALTGEAARRWLLDQAGVARDLAERFKTPVAEVAARVEVLEGQRRSLEKALAEARKALALGGGGAAQAGPEEVGGVAFLGRVLDGVSGKDLRGLVEDFKRQVGSGVVALVGVADGKAAVAVAVTSDLTGRFNAASLAKAAVLAMGGQGAGGKPDFAQGGAPDDSRAADGLTAVKTAMA